MGEWPQAPVGVNRGASVAGPYGGEDPVSWPDAAEGVPSAPGAGALGFDMPGVNVPGVDPPGVNTPGLNTSGVNPPSDMPSSAEGSPRTGATSPERPGASAAPRSVPASSGSGVVLAKSRAGEPRTSAASAGHPPPAPASGPSAPMPAPSRGATPRRPSGDPVKALLHRHRDLCEQAVDALEIAAGLEAQGITDRTAARFRHRDVFSLAEELYARVPRTGEPPPEPKPAVPVPRINAAWALLSLLPGAAAAGTAAGTRLTQGQPRLLVAAAGIVVVALTARAALRTGPLAVRDGRRRPRPWQGSLVSWTLWLLGYALFGDGLLHDVLTGGPDALPDGAPGGAWPTTTAPALALTLALAPAAWCAHLLAAGARRTLAGSRGLDDFTAAARPLLLGAFALFLGALAALLLACGKVLGEPAALPQALTLGALLLLARLLIAYRHRRAPVLALGAAAVTEAMALALPLAGRLPHCRLLALPVRTLTDTVGEPAVPALACGTAALALLLHAGRTLTRASAHAPTGAPG
ncbi:hypothetical protein K376_04394 [Streptomyces sp. PsTaAH-130]|nr:hypothetical protein K376_04394 [Streptomyces sp. PsTaAH-130]